jgi:hypothetical protein
LTVPKGLASEPGRQLDRWLSGCLASRADLPPLVLVAIPLEGEPRAVRHIRSSEEQRYLDWVTGQPALDALLALGVVRQREKA